MDERVPGLGRDLPVAEEAGANQPDRYARIRPIYLVTSVILIAIYPFLPTGGRNTVFLLASVAVIPAILVGLGRVDRDGRRTWAFLLAALVVIAVANAISLFPGEAAVAVSSLLDAAGNLLVLAAAIVLVVAQGRDNLGSIIDTAIAAIALGGVLWDLVLRPNLSPEYQSGAAKVAVCVVIFALSGVLGALVRLLVNSPAASVVPLIVALVLALVANIVFAATTTPLLLTLAGMMFVGAYTGVGLFSLATKSLRLMVPRTAGPDALSIGRLVFLGLAVAIVPIVVGVRMLAGDGRDGLVLIVSSAATTALVMVRIGQLSAQRDRAVQALTHEASHDPLTGLVNRKEFVHQLDAMLATSQRCVIMFCDLDRFKAVNDRFGHARGDQVLVEIAGRLRGAVPSDDVVGRFGGDEFVVLSPHTSDEDVQRTCRRIVDVLSRPLVIAGEQVTVGVTIGTTIAADGVDPEALIARADQAMYAAKDRDPWS